MVGSDETLRGNIMNDGRYRGGAKRAFHASMAPPRPHNHRKYHFQRAQAALQTDDGRYATPTARPLRQTLVGTKWRNQPINNVSATVGWFCPQPWFINKFDAGFQFLFENASRLLGFKSIGYSIQYSYSHFKALEDHEDSPVRPRRQQISNKHPHIRSRIANQIFMAHAVARRGSAGGAHRVLGHLSSF